LSGAEVRFTGEQLGRSVDRVDGFVAKSLEESGKVSRCVAANGGEPCSTQTAGSDGEHTVFAISKLGLEGPSRQDRDPKAGLTSSRIASVSGISFTAFGQIPAEFVLRRALSSSVDQPDGTTKHPTVLREPGVDDSRRTGRDRVAFRRGSGPLLHHALDQVQMPYFEIHD
jgi:hypothetical protein